MASEDLYLSHRDLIESLIASLCRRYRLYGADGDDFASVARLHLIENDYDVLRQFQGRSSLRTYLTIVLTRCYQDWRNARWGKWRSSAEARRMGPLGERLERLIVRDRLTLDEAWETLRTNSRLTMSRETLEAMAARLPARTSRRFVSDDMLAEVSRRDVNVHADLVRREAARAARDVAALLSEAIDRLAPQDRLIIRMRYLDDFTLADVARTLQIEQKPLYRRVSSILARLAADLTAQGVDRQLVLDLMAQGGFVEEIADPDGEWRDRVRLHVRDGHTIPRRLR